MGQKALVVCPHCTTSFQVEVSMSCSGGMTRQCPKCHKSVHIDIKQGAVSGVRK